MDDEALRLTLSPPGQQHNNNSGEGEGNRVVPPCGPTLCSPRPRRWEERLTFPSPPPPPPPPPPLPPYSHEAPLELYRSPHPPPPRLVTSYWPSPTPPSQPAESSSAELLQSPRAYSEPAGVLLEFNPSPRAYSQQAAASCASPPARSRQTSSSSVELIPSPPARVQHDSEPERSKPRRGQSSADRSVPRVKEEVIDPPFEWATSRRAKVHPLEWMLRSGIRFIKGEVLCKRCDTTQFMEVDLKVSFLQLDNYFMSNKHSLHDRAPKEWMFPRLLDCRLCNHDDCVRPVIPKRKRYINWLFLSLTGTLGVCTLDHLKYFCKHTHNHRTGAKDRVLYLTYVGLLDQLEPGRYLDANGKVL